MPFYKYLIYTRKSDTNKAAFSVPRSKDESDDTAVANQRMVNAIRHLSQLIRIADDIFGAIEIECRSIFERTKCLNVKIQHCQEVVDNLNAKAVKVPVSSLSGNQAISRHFKSCDVEKIDKSSIFSSFPRPPAVDQLRDLAYGPSPPVIISCDMVAPEVEDTGAVSSLGSPTHIYCKPVEVKENCKSSKDPNKNSENKTMTSDMKVPSSVVAIDVSGQTFSRMASFQRSLIHVDFLLRRKKKKDKRRNTVTEGDVKELKDALKNIVNDECQFSIPNTLSSYQEILANSKNAYNSKVHENQKTDKVLEEHNNNSADEKFMKKSNCSNSVESKNILDEKSGNCIKEELKLKDSENTLKQYLNKRKSKSHIPISTVSAAMNVAVEMRQCNSRSETPISNGVSNNIRDSYPNSKLHEYNKCYNSLSHEDDGLLENNCTSYKKRQQETCRTFASNIKTSNENIRNNTEIDVSSSASSENINPQDNTTSVGTSTESDSFFISSDESDEGSSDATYFKENFGSSTSLGTASYGSLNSLLSETGTEMTSSTGTLTSIERERLLTPPPPPPPMILSATVNGMDIVSKASELCITPDSETGTGQKCKIENAPQKPIKQPKASKSTKADLFDLQRNPTKNSKYTFSSLVNFKMNSKEKNKSKNNETQNKKLNKTSHQPVFDMYGTNSPTKPEKLSTFLKENVSPATHSKEKNSLKSFFADDSSKHPTQFLDEMSNMSKTQRNSQYLNHTKDLHCSKVKEIHAVNNIPQKYEHQVTVTPVQRHTDIEKKNTYHKCTVITDNEAKQNLMYGNIVKSGGINTDTQIHAAKIQRPQPPMTFNHYNRSKLAARVVLDFDGKVLYSTNSLDRKNCNSDNNVNMYSPIQNKLYDPHFRDTQSNNGNSYYNFKQECPMLNSTRSCYNSNVAYAPNTAVAYSSPTVPFNHSIKQNISLKNEHCARNESYSLKQIYEPKETLNAQYPISPKTENIKSFVPKRITVRPNSFAGDLSHTYLQNPTHSLKPDPNVSGLPVQETLLTKHNVNLHSKHMEQMDINSPESNYNHTPSNSVYMSLSSERSSPTNFNKSPQSTMSTEDLFAVIHNCKKRLNIKTDSNLSLASSSSRSSSPSYQRPSFSRGNLAETGFLSPRSHAHLETSRDRRSWADFRPVESISNDRKSLASDRLGPTKPTSMHDFKMLLLQARSSQISGPRKSAVEMLKVPPNQNSSESVKPLHLNLSPRNSVSFSVQNSPTTELNLYNGHSTIPFKRGNRARSLQSRYIMYPPIFEDCCEDSENCNDLLGNKPTDINNI